MESTKTRSVFRLVAITAAAVAMAFALSIVTAGKAMAWDDFHYDITLTPGKTVQVGEGTEQFHDDVLFEDDGVVTKVVDDSGEETRTYAKAVKGGYTTVVVYTYDRDEMDPNDSLEGVISRQIYHIFVKPTYEMRIGTIIKTGFTFDSWDSGSAAVDVFATSSNSKVAKVFYKTNESEGTKTVYLLGIGKGTATITIKTGSYFEGWSDDDGDHDGGWTYSDPMTFKVTVTGNANIPVEQCDRLYTGEYYGIAGLFTDYGGSTIQASKWQGKFVKGTGYTVHSNGKYVKFTKTGKVTLKFKNSNGTRYITVNAVHSKPTAKASLEKTLKAKYKSYRYKSMSEYKPSGKMHLKYTVLKNGKRVTKTAYYWFSQGKVYKKF